MNPKRYGSYDQTTRDCPTCKSGFLYQGCRICNNAQACAGYNTVEGQPSCCKCYKDSDQYKLDIHEKAN